MRPKAGVRLASVLLRTLNLRGGLLQGVHFDLYLSLLLVERPLVLGILDHSVVAHVLLVLLELVELFSDGVHYLRSRLNSKQLAELIKHLLESILVVAV